MMMIVLRFFIKPSLDASAMAIFKTPSPISKGTNKLSWIYLRSIIFFIFGSITFFSKLINSSESLEDSVFCIFV